MEGAFSWLGSIMESLGHLLPRIKHVEKNQVCVFFTRGNAKAYGPGLHLYWPVWSRPMVQSAVRQTFTLQTQTLTTSDGKSVTARAQVILVISDPILAFVETCSIEEAVVDMAMSGVKAVISKTPLSKLISNSRAVDTAIKLRVRSELKPFGVHVVRCFLSDFAAARVICLVQD